MSVSRYQVWDLCKAQYKYKYHLKLETGAEEPFYFAYGKIIHKIAQEYVGARGEQLISEVAEDVLNGKIELEKGVKAPPLLPEYQRKFPEHLNNIKKLTDKLGFDGELEYNFRYDMAPPFGKYVLGFIDRLIQKDDQFWIIDYKTTKQGWWRKGPNEVVSDLQLRCYARVVQRVFGANAENIKAALYYLEGGELVGANFSEQSLLSVEKDLLQAYIEIENTPPEKAHGNVGKHCARCDFRPICTYYSLV